MSSVEAALADVNAIRAEFMLPPLPELPRGVRRDADRCAIAMALRECSRAATVRVGPENIRIVDPKLSGDRVHARITPDPIAAFIADFDHGAYDDLAVPLEQTLA